MNIGGNDLLSQVEDENPKLGQLLRSYIIPAIQSRGLAGHVLATPTDKPGDVELQPLSGLVTNNNPKSQAYVGTDSTGAIVGASTPTSGINQLTGDVVAGPGTGSQVATVKGVNGATVPVSAAAVGTNGSGQLTPVSGLPPTGAAGGDLSGTYPNPTVHQVNGGAVPVSAAYVGTDGSGHIVAATTPTSGITQLTGDVTAGPGSGSQAATLASTAVTPGSYTNTNLTVDAKGRITAAANGSAGGVTSVTGTAPITSSGGSTPNIAINLGSSSAPGALQVDGTSIIASGGVISTTGSAAIKGTYTGNTAFYSSASTPSSPVTAAFGSAITQGSAILLFVQLFGGSLTPTTITDTLGNTYSPVTSDGAFQVCYIALNSPGGANTVTVNFTGSFATLSLRAFEYRNVVGASSVDGFGVSHTDTGGGVYVTPSFTTTVPADVLIGHAWMGGTPITSTFTAGYTQRFTNHDATINFTEFLLDQNVTSAGAQSLTWTETTVATHSLLLVALKVATGVTDFNGKVGHVTGMATLTTTGSSGAATYNASTGTLNVPNYSLATNYQPTPFPYPPAFSGFTWVNQNSNSVANNGNPWTITGPFNSTTQWGYLYVLNAFSTPYAIGAGLTGWFPGGFQGLGLILTDGTKFINLEMANSGTNLVITIERWTNPTTFSSTVFSQTTVGGSTTTLPVLSATAGVCYLRWRNDGSNLFADISIDGFKWQNIYSEAVGAFLTPTGYGVGVRSQASGKSCFFTLLGWNPVNNANL